MKKSKNKKKKQKKIVSVVNHSGGITLISAFFATILSFFAAIRYPQDRIWVLPAGNRENPTLTWLNWVLKSTY